MQRTKNPWVRVSFNFLDRRGGKFCRIVSSRLRFNARIDPPRGENFIIAEPSILTIISRVSRCETRQWEFIQRQTSRKWNRTASRLNPAIVTSLHASLTARHLTTRPSNNFSILSPPPPPGSRVNSTRNSRYQTSQSFNFQRSRFASTACSGSTTRKQTTTIVYIDLFVVRIDIQNFLLQSIKIATTYDCFDYVDKNENVG